MSRIEELEKRLAADPNSRMFVQLAEEYRKAGLLEQAIEVCENGLKAHPQYPSARVALGRALLEAESLDRARQEFEAVLKQIPDNILANKFLGETYHRMGRHSEAIEKYRVAQALAPEDHELSDKMAALQSEMATGGTKSVSTPPPEPALPPPPEQPALPDVPPVSLPAEAALPPPPAPPEETSSPLDDDLPPIPLVDVDEPMVLEQPHERFASPAPEAAAHSTASEPAPALAEPIPADPERVPEARSQPRSPSPDSPGIETPTIAEIYVSQGHFVQAIDVYEKLLERDASHTAYRNRIEELQRLANPISSGGGPSKESEPMGQEAERTLHVLEQWLENIRRARRA